MGILRMTISRHKHFEQSLRSVASNWFNAKGYAKGSYILPRWEDWPHNIILPEVVEYIENERKRREAGGERFPLHKWIHHGMSSQAMLFNLIGPLIVCRNLAPLRDAFVRRGVEWPDGEVLGRFEYENPDVFGEYGGQPTSMDLVFGADGAAPNIFVEAKLVEREFGGCSLFSDGDCDGRNPSGNFGLCYLHEKKKRL